MFVSSTYYDLKYVRERLERFLYTYNMEPILFERDDVYFNPVETIDISCYNEVHNCQMMILIIGGRYGSLASTKEDYEKKYVSVTQKEYNTAISKGIPVMIFVDSNVYTEYRTYQKNKHSLPDNFKFAYVDDLQVFEFIASVEQQAIKTFSRIEDIEHYLGYQISGMLYSYLLQLQERKSQEGMSNVLDQIKIASDSMQAMLNMIGKQLLGNDSKQYKELIRQQNCDLIDFFLELFEQNFEWSISLENDEVETKRIEDALFETIFNNDRIIEFQNAKKFSLRSKLINQLETDTRNALLLAMPGSPSPEIRVTNFLKQFIKINSLIRSEKGLMNYFKDKLRKSIGWVCL